MICSKIVEVQWRKLGQDSEGIQNKAHWSFTSDSESTYTEDVQTEVKDWTLKKKIISEAELREDTCPEIPRHPSELVLWSFTLDQDQHIWRHSFWSRRLKTEEGKLLRSRTLRRFHLIEDLKALSEKVFTTLFHWLRGSLFTTL